MNNNSYYTNQPMYYGNRNPYGNYIMQPMQYNVQPQPQQQQPIQQPVQPAQPISGLLGRTVESVDVVKALEIPLDRKYKLFSVG